MAKKIVVNFDIDNKPLDEAQKKVDDLKESAELIGVNIEVNSDDVEKAKEEIDSLVETAGDIDVVIGIDTEAIAIAQTELDELRAAGSGIDLDVGVKIEDKALDVAQKKINDLQDDVDDIELSVNVDTDSIDDAKKDIKSLSKVPINDVTVSAQVEVDDSQVTEAQSQLETLDSLTNISTTVLEVDDSELLDAQAELDKLEGMTDIPDVLVRAKDTEVRAANQDIFILRDTIDEVSDTPIEIEVESKELDSIKDKLLATRDTIREYSKEIRSLYAQLYNSTGENADELTNRINELKKSELDLRDLRDNLKNDISKLRTEASKPISTKIFVNGEEIDEASEKYNELKNEVKSKPEVKFNVDSKEFDIVSDKFVNLRQQLSLLRKERDKYAEGSDAFIQLSAQIEDAQGKIDRINITGKELFNTLGALPGPIGQFALEVDRTEGTVEAFTSLTLNELKSKITAFGDSIANIAKRIGDITGLTKVYNATVNGLTKAMTALGVAENTAAAGAKALASALAITGIFAIAAAVMVLVDAFNRYNDELDRNIELEKERIEVLEKRSKAQYDAQLAAIQRQTDLEESAAKRAGKTEEELFKIRQNGRKREIKALEEYYNELANKDDDNARNTLITIKNLQNALQVEENNFYASRKEDKDKEFDDEKSRIQALANLRLAELEKRKQEEGKGITDPLERIKLDEKYAQLSYNIKKKALEDEAKLYKPGSVDAINIKTALIQLNTELINTQQGFSDQRKAINLEQLNSLLDAMQEEAEKANEKYAQYQEDQRVMRISALQDQMDELNRLNGEFGYDFSEDIKRLEKKKELLDQQMAIELENVALTEREKNEIIKKYGKERADIEKEITDTKRAEEEARYNIALTYANSLGEIGKIIAASAGESKKQAKIGLLIEQAAALASVAINAAKNFVKDGGIKSPLAWANLTASAVQAASIVAATITGIRNIDKVNSSATATGGQASGIGSFGSSSSNAVPNMGRTQNQTGILAEIVKSAIQRDQSKDRPIRAYVVGNDINTQEQLNRRVRTAARLG